jgi:hypothetical protein
MREELEALEYHPHPRAHRTQRTLVLRQQRTFELDVAAVDRLEPVRAAKSVDFPDPEGPIRHTTSPAWTSRSTPFNAVNEPKRLITPR